MFGISLKTIPFPPLIKFDLFYYTLLVIAGDTIIGALSALAYIGLTYLYISACILWQTWYNFGMTTPAQPKLSNTSKMPSKSWSLPAWETCLGARITDYDTNKPDVADACKGCYALTGAYMFPNTIKAREHNVLDWQKTDWVQAMVKLIGKAKYFRWFDSGDVYAVALAEKITLVIRATPNCLHWLPTRAYKDTPIRAVFNRMTTKYHYHKSSYSEAERVDSGDYLPNAIIRYSSDSVNGKRLSNKMGLNSVIIQSESDFIPEKGYALCRAYTRGGSCGDCRACWSDKVDTVAYIYHGRSKPNAKNFLKPLLEV